MTSIINSDQLGAFGSLAEALGITVEGDLNPTWFEAPLGDTDTDKAGLTTLMYDDRQRDALLEFVDETLGAPDNETDGDAIWVPLFTESQTVISAVVTPREGSVILGFGVEYDRGGSAPTVELRASINVFQFNRRGGSLDTSGSLPDWLILGRSGGTVDIDMTAVLSTQAPTPDEAYLGGIGLGVSIPTSSQDALAIRLTLDRLQLPGTDAARTFTLDVDSLDSIDADVYDFLLGLIQAQAQALDPGDPLTARFAGLAGVLGLRTVPNLPAFPLGDLAQSGAVAFTDWINSILTNDSAIDAWLSQLALLLDATVDTDRNAVTFELNNAVDLVVGLRVDSAPGDGLILVPWVQAAYSVRNGADVRASADVLAYNTTTRTVASFPAFAAHAVFGQEAGASQPLLSGDPRIGTIRTGIALRDGQPAFALTLYDVEIAGTTHDSLDLSSPQAALDAATGVLDTAIIDALSGLGRPGELALLLIGLQPPATISAVSTSDLLTNPVGAVADYWAAVVADTDALEQVVSGIAELLIGTAGPLVGAGRPDDPWRIALADGPGAPAEVALEVFVDGTVIGADIAVDFEADPLALADSPAGANPGASALVPALEAQVGLVRIDVATGSARFMTSVDAALALRGDDGPIRLPLGEAALVADALGVAVAWSQASGFAAMIAAPGLGLDVPAVLVDPIEIPLPVIGANGLSFDPEPDWDAVELLVAHLLENSGSSALASIMALLGWSGAGARLDLGMLLSDPDAAVRSWLGDMVLDCDQIHAVLGPLNYLLNGLRQGTYTGAGTEVDPLRLSFGTSPKAPGVAVWTDTGCPRPLSKYEQRPGSLDLELAPEPDHIAAALVGAATRDRGLDLLMFGRTNLAEGIEQLADRIIGTDGVVAMPDGLPSDVNATRLDDWSYRELIAGGISGNLLKEELGLEPPAVVHIGCEELWTEAFGTANGFDASIGETPSALALTGNGTWSIRLPLPLAAGVDRPDLSPVAAQTERLHQVIGDRTDPIVVVAYGAAGAAALTEAQTNTAIERVVTVGVPWGLVATTGFTNGLSGDALRCFEHLGSLETATWPEDMLAREIADDARAQLLIDRALQIVPANLPSVENTARRTGLEVDAVFGHLSEDEVLVAFGAFVQHAITQRFEIANSTPAAEPSSLHLGLGLPVVETTVGAATLGAGVTVELVNADRGPSGDSFAVDYDPTLIFELRFGFEDSWLVGGPGEPDSTVDVRWMSARLGVPLEADEPAWCELTLHEATCFGIYREQWKVARVDTDGTVTSSSSSEVHIMVGEIIDRLGAIADARTADLTQFLAACGLIRHGGYDPAGLDRLIYDTRAAIDSILAGDRALLAASIRSLAGASGTGTEIALISEFATTTFDLAMPSMTVSGTQSLGGIGDVAVSATLDPSGVEGQVSVGKLDAATGGVELVARFGSRSSANNDLVVQWQDAGGTTTTVSLLPAVSPERIAPILAALATASLAQAGVDYLRSLLSPDQLEHVDQILESLGVIRGPEPGLPPGATLPIGLFLDPATWLSNAAPGWVSDPLSQAVATLEAIAPLVVPDRTGTGWPLADNITLDYTTTAGRLVLAVDVSLTHDFAGSSGSSANTLAATLGAGLSIGLDGSVQPSLDAQVLAGPGLGLAIAPQLRVDLLRPSQPPLPLYPSGPGLGEALGAVATSVLPIVLDAIADERTNSSPSLRRSVGQVVFDLGGAMGLRDGDDFSEPLISMFAADPALALAAHASDLVTLGLNTIAEALDGSAGRIVARPDGAGRVALELGIGAPVTVVIDAGPAGPAIELAASFEIPDVGRIEIDPLRLSLTGASFEIRFESTGLDVGGGLELFPIVVVRAGVGTAAPQRLFAFGLCFGDGHDRAVEFRWALNATAPRVAVVDRTAGGESEDTDVADVAIALTTLGLGLVTQIAEEALGENFFAVLDGVLFISGTRTLDPNLIDDIDDVGALLNRLGQLAINIADQLPALTIGGVVEVGLNRQANRVGISLDLAGDSLELASGETTVSLVADDSWIIDPGSGALTIWLFDRPGATFELSPDFEMRGVGLRVNKTSGPLLDLGGASIDAIAVHLYFESQMADVGLGAQIQLDGLSISPGGGGNQPDGEQNSVANKIMADAGDGASPAARPSFSPAVALQAPPGEDARLSVRAGEPPGPWWIVVQRQLGPLYMEQFGFNSTENADGQLTGISLLFDAKLDIFGLTAQVDQLGVHWLGGDVFDVNNWRVDLQGLAIAADFSGVAISGGLLKTSLDGNVGYVGMLLGRFGVYGLSLFGGYTDQDGVPSFFVFGAVNGPIGGPPAFFITGLGGGLGINRGLRVPDDVGQMNEYPFIKALDPAASPSDNPLEELRELAEYFPPENGTFWFAAGLSFNSFALVDGVAVASVSFGNGLEINLFGLARMALPRPEAALVSIELGLLARFSTSEGLFLIQAQLTENSWLLYPEVRLTGGFAFATWWKGPNRGQFVLTIGGYHPDFSRDGYPVVPRVGLEWKITNDIVVKGGSYFALTSEALMAGVEVVVSADFGFLWAEVRFGADGIVYFDPFWFQVSAYAKIKAGCRIKTFLGTIRFSISLGASIVVQGPKFNGVATVEIGPFEASVPFGSKQRVEPITASWAEFVDKYLEAASPGVARGMTGITGKGTMPAATGGDDSAPSSDGTSERPYQVFPEFEVMLVSPLPIENLSARGSGAAAVFSMGFSPTRALGIGPMGVTDLDSTLNLYLELFDQQNQRWVQQPGLEKLLAGLQAESETASAATYGTEGFPIGVWGEPGDTTPANSALPKGDVVIATSRLKLVAEADIAPAIIPEIDFRQVESGRRPLPLSATGRTRGAMLNLAGALTQPSTVSQAMVGAQNQLFAPASQIQAEGRSEVGRAAFARSRTAPPRFGSLTDGMLRSAPSSLASTRLDAPVAAEPASPRPPYVSGYLTAGAGVVRRTGGTTVSDASIKRRRAPSIASVNGRLGRQLPISLIQTQVPAEAAATTVISRGALPRTDVGTAAVSYRGSRIGGAIGGSVVAGLAGQQRSPRSPRALDPGATIRPGDVVVLTVPDPERDRSQERPTLTIKGTARVAVLRASGQVMFDKIVTDERVEIGPRARFAVVQADGDVEATDMAIADKRGSRQAVAIGWHGGSRLAAASNSIAIGAGCVVHAESTQTNNQTGWLTANAFTRRAGATTTTFDRQVRTIAVAMRATAVERVRSMAIELGGATRVQRNGRDVAPTVVQAGEQSLLVFEVIADDGDQPISVRVLAGGDRRVCGVLGSGLDADAFAEALAELGADQITSRMRANEGNGCSIEWTAAPTPSRRISGERRRDNEGVEIIDLTDPAERALIPTTEPDPEPDPDSGPDPGVVVGVTQPNASNTRNARNGRN